jgi:predicted dehydrogenase
MSARALELGLVGFGQLARRYYAPALRSRTDIRVSVVVDPFGPSQASAREAFPDVVTAATADALFDQPLDGLIVASPPSTHLSLWNLAAGANLPVFLEKPFVLRGELPYAASGPQARKLLMLDHNRRFWPPYRRIRDAVQASLLGDITTLDILMHVDIRPWCSVTAHRLEPNEGGVLFDLGSQAIDLAYWITGSEPHSVSASSESRAWPNDHLRLQLNFQNGLEARCSLAYTNDAAERIRLIGTRGVIELNNPNMSVHLRGPEKPGGRPWAGASRWTVRDLAVLGYRGLRRSRSMMRYSVAAALGAFVSSIRCNLPFEPGFDDAVATARCLDVMATSLDPGVAAAPASRADPSLSRG